MNPMFHVWCPDDEDSESAIEIRTLNAESAAQEWAAMHDQNGTYPIVSGKSKVVIVLQQEPCVEETLWEVRGEMDLAYYARAVK